MQIYHYFSPSSQNSRQMSLAHCLLSAVTMRYIRWELCENLWDDYPSFFKLKFPHMGLKVGAGNIIFKTMSTTNIFKVRQWALQLSCCGQYSNSTITFRERKTQSWHFCVIQRTAVHMASYRQHFATSCKTSDVSVLIFQNCTSTINK